MLTMNASGLLEKIGVSASYVTSGEFKDMGSPFRSVRPEERAMFQSLIDQFYGRFVQLVAGSRKLAETRVRAIADGRVHTATEALALGLVDRIGYLEDAIAMARTAAGLTEARVVTYHRPRQFRATIYSSSQAPQPAVGLPDLARLVVAGPRFLYLWWP
jgi:protease-4